MREFAYNDYQNTLNYFLMDLAAMDEDVLIWVHDDEKNRVRYPAKLAKFDVKNLEITIYPNDTSFDIMAPTVFVHVPSKEAIFKLNRISSTESEVQCQIPEKVIFLNRPPTPQREENASGQKTDAQIMQETLDFQTLDEEDRHFEGQREAPRARPEIDKHTHVKRVKDGKEMVFTLFDLSKGGIAILAPREIHFLVGEELEVLGFDSDRLNQPLRAEIMNIKEVPQIDYDLYKVGMKFLD
jgi:hypothetical protein